MAAEGGRAETGQAGAGQAATLGHAALRAKLRRPDIAGPAVLPADRALAGAFTRAAQEGLGLALAVTSLTEARMTLSDLPEALDDHALLAVIEGASEALGLLALAPGLVASVIEMRTMGRLSAQPPSPRRVTSTDAALASDLIDAVMAAFDTALQGGEDLSWAAGYRYGSRLDDPRALPLVLEDTEYRVMRMDLVLGRDGPLREARAVLALPADPLALRHPLALPAPSAGSGAVAAAMTAGGAAGAGAGAGPPSDEAWHEALERAVLDAPARVDAVLARITLPLSRILALKPGLMLPVAAGQIDRIRLEGPGGRLACTGRLGQQGGMRAVRIQPPPEGGSLAPAGGGFYGGAAEVAQDAAMAQMAMGGAGLAGGFGADGDAPGDYGGAAMGGAGLAGLSGLPDLAPAAMGGGMGGAMGGALGGDDSGESAGLGLAPLGLAGLALPPDAMMPGPLSLDLPDDEPMIRPLSIGGMGG